MSLTVSRATHHLLLSSERLVLAAAPVEGQPPQLDELGAADQCSVCGREQSDLRWTEELAAFVCPCAARYPLFPGGYRCEVHDEVPTWTLRCDDAEHEVRAADLAAAKAAALEWLHSWAPAPEGGTVFYRVRIVDPAGDPADVMMVGVDPREPPCAKDCHDWTRPHDIVGGLESNPGVRANAGGVIATDVCIHCGYTRITDTWAQDPATGVQGLRSLRFDAEVNAESVAKRRELDAPTRRRRHAPPLWPFDRGPKGSH